MATVAHSVITIRHGFEDPNDPVLVALFATGCVAALVIACGPLWALADRRRVTRAMTRVVEELDDSPTIGYLEAALAQATHDPNLGVAYWLSDSGRYTDGQGRPVPEPLPGPGLIATPVVRDGTRIAVVSHSADLVELERALGSDLRLALDNERLQAEVLAQLHDLTESRSRLVEAGDERRRQLERNLHDGAQQSLLGLSYDVRVARAAAVTSGASELVDLLDSATSEISEAFAELREVAHGIFPAVLSQAGIGPALKTLTETCPIPVELECTVAERLPVAVEIAAYILVADGLEVAHASGATSATITITRRNDHLTVDLATDRAAGLADTIHIADRVGAVGGTLIAGSRGLEAEIPCAS